MFITIGVGLLILFMIAASLFIGEIEKVMQTCYPYLSLDRSLYLSRKQQERQY